MPIYYHIIRAFEILKCMHITSAKLKKHGRKYSEINIGAYKVIAKKHGFEKSEYTAK